MVTVKTSNEVKQLQFILLGDLLNLQEFFI